MLRFFSFEVLFLCFDQLVLYYISDVNVVLFTALDLFDSLSVWIKQILLFWKWTFNMINAFCFGILTIY